MQEPGIDEKKVRDQLKQERNLSVETYSRNPMQIRLAIEIKFIDDRIAELTEHLVRQKKSRTARSWVLADAVVRDFQTAEAATIRAAFRREQGNAPARA